LEYALGAEAFARQVLHADWERDARRPRVDGMSDVWAERTPPFPIEQGAIELRVADLQGRFNLNAVASESGYERFQRLLSEVGGDPSLADALRDWIDSDQQARPLGAEDGAYLLARPAYRAANRPLAEVSDLRLLEGMNDDLYRRIEPLVAALPSPQATLNVNTARPQVLQLFGEALDATRASVFARPAEPWESVAELLDEAPSLQTSRDALGVDSSFFELRARASFGGYTVRMRSVIHRDPQTGRTRVLSRDLGQPFAPGGSDSASGEPSGRGL